MATSAQQKIYNQKWRAKRNKIKQLTKQLDDLEVMLENLPKCPACVADSAHWNVSVRCWHTHAHKDATVTAELVRGQLRQLEH